MHNTDWDRHRHSVYFVSIVNVIIVLKISFFDQLFLDEESIIAKGLSYDWFRCA